MLRGVGSDDPIRHGLVGSTLTINGRCGMRCGLHKLVPPLSLHLHCGFCRGAVVTVLGGALNLRGTGFFPATKTTVPPTIRRFVRTINVSVVTNCNLARSATAIDYSHRGVPHAVNSMNHIVSKLRIGVNRGNRVLLHKGAVAGNCCGGRRTAVRTVSTSN